MRRAPIMGGEEGLQTDPYGMPILQPDPANPLDAAQNMLSKHMGGPEGDVTWGGKTWQDPNKLWGWIAARGGGLAGTGPGAKESFFKMHPDAARRLGVDIEGDLDPMDPQQLKRGLIGQLTQAEGALRGGPVQGIHKIADRRMRAVGAAQGRAAQLAQIMARRLRGRGGSGMPPTMRRFAP